MKKTMLSLLIISSCALANASIPTKSDIFNTKPLFLTEEKKVSLENKYLKEVYEKIPDMQDVGVESNKRSEKEGAALQLIMTTGISLTGLAKDDFAHLLNNEAAMVKEYVQNTKSKGYIMIENILFFSKGYPDLPPQELNDFKKTAECQNGYCVFVGIKSIKYFNEKFEELPFDKDRFSTIITKYTNSNRLWEVKPHEIPESYNVKGVSVIAGFGLGGLDILDMFKNKSPNKQ